MRHLVILGAGTAGTMVANRLRRRLSRRQWRITVVDDAIAHLHQPGLLHVPFGAGKLQTLVKPRQRTLTSGAELVVGDVDCVNPAERGVVPADGRTLGYDFLLIGNGTQPRPDQTPGMPGDGRQAPAGGGVTCPPR